MHLLILKDGIQFTNKDKVEPGAYIAETQNAAQFLAVADAGTMNELKEERLFDDTEDWNGKKILLMRVGGFGDLVLMTPVPREIKRRWPNCHISVCCQNLYGVVLQGLSYIDEIINYPLSYDKAQGFDAWIFFEKAVEKNPRAHELHITDLFAEIARLTAMGGPRGTFFKSTLQWTDDKRPEYVVTKNEAIWALEQYPRTGKQRACIQFVTSTANRNYLQMQAVILGLLNKGFEVFLIGGPGESGDTKEVGDVFRDLTTKGLSFRQTCAVINTADLVVSPDTAALHIAGALGIPAVGLFGPFPGDLRVRYCPTTVHLTAKGICAPCFHHMNPGRARWTQFPSGKPCEEAGYCVVMGGIQGKNKEGNPDGKFSKGIDPKDVVQKAVKIAKKFSLT